MIERYSTPEMARAWSEESRFQRWLDVEIAVCRALARRGIIPEDDLRAIETKASFDIGRIGQIEQTTHHDVVAFTTAVAESLGPESRFIHYGLTSTDVVDTAQALAFKEVTAILRRELEGLMATMRRAAFRHQFTPMVGRTHGVHAEPLSFGLKFAVWYEEMSRNMERLAAAAAGVICGKISGAVGTFAHLPPEVEEEVCRDLGIAFAPASTQTLQRDRHAHFVATLAVIAGSLEKIALEIRLLQQTEIREAEEPFRQGQKGSSAMPHKRNPVKCEQICGLARIVRSHALAALENQALWHERDISHSSAERIILPDSTTLVHYMTRQLNAILDQFHVYPEQMRRNLEQLHGLIFSGQLLLALTEKGVSRETAYLWVQRNAMRVWETGEEFRPLVDADPEIRQHLDTGEIDRIFDLTHQLRHIRTIFRRVFGTGEEKT